MTGVRQLFTMLLDVVLPPLCHLCRSFIPDAGELHICLNCQKKLPLVVSPLCPLCGIPYRGAGDDHRCGSCLTNPPHFDIARAPFLYEGPLRDMIHSFKYNRLTHLRKPLSLLALKAADDFMKHGPRLVVPVPLHHSRLRERGFNQAVLIGQTLSRHLSLPMQPDTLTRTRQTEPQIELSAAERRLNVKGAFSVGKPELVAGKRVLLVDDVMTTGSTMDECARELKKAGAEMVIAATIARTARS